MDGHEGSWLTYINVILYKGKPWGMVGLAVFPFLVFQTIRKGEGRNWLVISWAVIVLLVFSLVKTKLHWYIIPVYPAMALIAGWGMDGLLKKYSTAVVITVSVVSLVYFGAKKDIFTLDYNRAIKDFSLDVANRLDEGQELYLYDVGDPGMKFYFGGLGRNIYEREEFSRITGRKGVVIVMTKERFGQEDLSGTVLSSTDAGYTAVVTE